MRQFVRYASQKSLGWSDYALKNFRSNPKTRKTIRFHTFPCASLRLLCVSAGRLLSHSLMKRWPAASQR